jgi:beta-lactamase regulating signal transducer with metallopeptidase domain
MESYLLKSAACLAIFYWFYKLLLENENMHTFKRCYLLVMLIFSFLIPLISFSTNVVSTKTISPIVFTNLNIEDANNVFLSEILPLLLGTIYLIGVVFFSFRFGKNLFSLIVKIKKNPKLKAPSHVNVLLKHEVIPHTFLKYIFLNQSKFETKKIPKEVLFHEQTHAIQKHSLDILFIELIQIICWFNPFIYFIRKSIKLNHEFLADQAVLSKGINSSQYQNLLLLFSSNTTTPVLANSINFSLIKKRFTVMKKQKSKRKIWIRSFLLLPLLTVLIYSFSSVQEIEKYNSASIEVTIQNGATKAQITEYNTLAKKYNDEATSNKRIKKSDVERLKNLYQLMSDRQKNNAESFPDFPPYPPSPEKSLEPIRVIMGVNDKDPNVPPPPPKAPQPVKVIKGKNDTEATIPPPPLHVQKISKAIKDPLKYIEKLADEGARFLFFDGGPHHKNGMDISKEKAVDILKKHKGVRVNVRDENYIYKIVEIRLEGC